jgi:hypothetical protein
MKKTINPEDFARVAVYIDNFTHDTNGNPVARHTVYAYRNQEQALDQPSAELYQTRQRQQVGSTNDRDDWAGTALNKAGFPAMEFTRREGDRSGGLIVLVYDLPRFKVGQIVNYTNCYGVFWGARTITSIERRTGRPCYNITPTDTPWFAVGEECFSDASEPTHTFKLHGLTFKTYAFPRDSDANAFMLQYPGWGLIGIEGEDGLRHVAHEDDKGQ